MGRFSKCSGFIDVFLNFEFTYQSNEKPARSKRSSDGEVERAGRFAGVAG